MSTAGLPDPGALIDVIGVPSPELARFLIRKLDLVQVIEERVDGGSAEAA